MLKTFAYGIGGIILAFLCAAFAYFTYYIASTEVLPALEKGSLNVESNTMVLNILWEGNEIYVLLTAYILLAGAFAYAAIRLIAAARRSRGYDS